MKKVWLGLIAAMLNAPFAVAQDDLDMLGELEDNTNQTEYVSSSYKSSRIINSVSLKNTPQGVLDFRISHRFGTLNTGFEGFFGLDDANTRIGFDYGVVPWLMVGAGRSTLDKAYDGFYKIRILRQSIGARNMPLSVQFFSSVMINSLKVSNPNKMLFSSRIGYTFQVILGRKFSKNITVQLMPALVHRNFVETRAESNDVFSIGIGGRQKYSRRGAITYEFYYVFSNQLAPGVANYSFSIGIDIETGGHVFQLFLTNSGGMNEQQFITNTINDWGKGEIRLGFNISRVFTIVRPKY